MLGTYSQDYTFRGASNRANEGQLLKLESLLR